MLKDMQLSQTNRPIDSLRYWRDGNMLELSPPYQRGDVWGRKRRVNLIRSILLGVPIPSIVVNDRGRADWSDDIRVAVIDGKQRITTVLMFLDNEFPVPGDWFGVESDLVRFCDLPRASQRKFENRPLAFSEGRLPTIGDEIEVFDLVNFGGLAQGEQDEYDTQERR